MTSENRSQQVHVAAVYVTAMFMSVLNTTIVTVALPTIAREFDVTTTAVGSVSIAYLVALTVFIPVSGWLGERIGGKRALLGSILLFAIGSALCGLATSLPMLIGFSALQGVGGAIMLPVGLTMLFRVYPPEERVRLSSTLALVTAIGPAIGPVLGGAFTTYASWRLVFFVNVPVAAVALVWGALRLDRHAQPHPGRLDVVGLMLAAGGLGALMTGVSEGTTLGWDDPAVVIAIVVGAGLLVALVLVELRVERPLIDMRLFRHRLFAAATSLYGLGSVAYIGALYLVAMFLQEGLGASAMTSGLTTVGAAIGVIVGSQLVTRVLYPRIGPRRLIAGGLVVIAISLTAMALVTASTSLWIVRTILFALGLGVAAVFIPSQAISMATLSKAEIGKASPVFNAGKQLGSAVGVALLSTIVAAAGSGAGRGGLDLTPYRVAFLAAAVIALASVAVAASIRDGDAASTITPRADRSTDGRVAVRAAHPD
jgi:EmrB/QacA subfamily drug resistance transporter